MGSINKDRCSVKKKPARFVKTNEIKPKNSKKSVNLFIISSTENNGVSSWTL